MRNIILVGAILSLIPGHVYGMEETPSDAPFSNYFPPKVLRMTEKITTLIKEDMGKSENDSLGPCDCCAVICCWECLRDPIEKFMNDRDLGNGVGAISGTAITAAISLCGFYSGSTGVAFVSSLPYMNTARLWATALYKRNKKKSE